VGVRVSVGVTLGRGLGEGETDGETVKVGVFSSVAVHVGDADVGICAQPVKTDKTMIRKRGKPILGWNVFIFQPIYF